MIGQFFGYNDGNIKCKRVVIMTHQNLSVGNCFEHLCENRRSYILVFVLTKHVSLRFTLRPCLTRTLKRDVSLWWPYLLDSTVHNFIVIYLHYGKTIFLEIVFAQPLYGPKRPRSVVVVVDLEIIPVFTYLGSN